MVIVKLRILVHSKVSVKLSTYGAVAWTLAKATDDASMMVMFPSSEREVFRKAHSPEYSEIFELKIDMFSTVSWSELRLSIHSTRKAMTLVITMSGTPNPPVSSIRSMMVGK